MIEKYVSSYEKSKMLMELGFKRDHCFVINKYKIIKKSGFIYFTEEGKQIEYIPAYLVGELMEELKYFSIKVINLKGGIIDGAKMKIIVEKKEVN